MVIFVNSLLDWLYVVSQAPSIKFNIAQGSMKRAPNETQTHSQRFASLAC